MNAHEFRQTVADEIHVLLPELKTSQIHAGRVTLDEVKRIMTKLPAVLVSILKINSSEQLETGEKEQTFLMSAFVVTRDTRKLSKDESGLNIASALTEYIPETTWSQVGKGVNPAKRVRGDNLYSGKVDKYGVALWGVAWEQSIIVGEDEFSPEPGAILPTHLYTSGCEEDYGIAEEYDHLAPEE